MTMREEFEKWCRENWDIRSQFECWQEATLREREACAKIADKFVGCEQIAAAIRSRGDNDSTQ